MPRAAIILSLLLLAACSVGPDYERPALSLPDGYRFSARQAEDVANTRWWARFDDPVLDALVEGALLANLDIRIAAARVEQFAAQLRIARSPWYPQLGYGASGSRQGVKAPLPGQLDTLSDSYLASVGAAWELDIWGRVRRANEAARAELWESEEVRRAVILSLTASVAAGYVSLCSLDRQLEIAVQTREARRKALDLFELQFLGGVIGDLQLAQVRSEYERAAAVVPNLEQQIAQQENLISVLLGREPGSIPRGAGIDALQLPAVPAGLPAELLVRRPDIRAAEQRLIAANARIGVARAAYFPRISLTGLAGYASPDLDQWFEDSSRLWSLGADLAGPIFAGGRIKGSVKQAEAVRKAALYDYRQAILVALREVEDGLVQVGKSSEQLLIEQRRVDALKDYARLAQLRYDNGYSSYIEVLDAQRSLFDAQLNYVTTQNRIFAGLINTYKAMGGGWVELAQESADRVDFPDAGGGQPSPAPAQPAEER